MKISALTGTRHRPSGMVRFTESLFSTASDPDCIEVVFYIDNDDIESKNCAEQLKDKYNVRYIFGERIFNSDHVNKCAEIATGECFFMGSDDVVMRTVGWDQIVTDAFNNIEDKIAFLYGHDNNKINLFGTHGFVHKNWVDVVGGRIQPTNIRGGIGDQWLNTIARKLNRHFFIHIFTDHLHPGITGRRLLQIIEEHNISWKQVRNKTIVDVDETVKEQIYMMYDKMKNAEDDVYEETKKQMNRQRRSQEFGNLEKEMKIQSRIDHAKLQAFINTFQEKKMYDFIIQLTEEYDIFDRQFKLKSYLSGSKG